MKKSLSILAALFLIISSLSIISFAQDSVTSVYVTISDGSGKAVVTQKKIALSDTDSDGKLTINDALYLVHEEAYTGGAAAGYATSVTAYGKGITKLWGIENGGSYGYYVNNVSAWNLDDTLSDGDYVYAYAFSDLNKYSDKYSFFDVNTVSVKQNDTVELTLSAASFDENWNPVTVPVAGAVITIDGVNTSFVTDENGKASVAFAEGGTHTVSAVSSSMVLVPPVLTAVVEALPATAEETPAEETSVEKVAVSSESTTNTEIPKTGRQSISLFTAAAILSVSALSAVSLKKKKNEK